MPSGTAPISPVDLQRTIASIWRKQSFASALRGVEAALLVARRCRFLANDPDLLALSVLPLYRVANAGPGALIIWNSPAGTAFIAHTVPGVLRRLPSAHRSKISMSLCGCVPNPRLRRSHRRANHTQRREPHKVRIVIPAKRKGMPESSQLFMIRMTAVVCFA